MPSDHGAPPQPEELVEAPPPTGRHPDHQRRVRRATVAAVVIGGLVLVGALSALPILSLPAPSTIDTTGPTLVTASPSRAPSAASTASSGGGLGVPVMFTAPDGDGTLTVTRAVWTDTGDAAPPAGARYLVLDVTVACSRGTFALSPVLLQVSSGSTKVLPGFGPAVDRSLGGVVLSAGKHEAGRVGYVLAPGPARLSLLDEDLRPLASVDIPAP